VLDSSGGSPFTLNGVPASTLMFSAGAVPATGYATVLPQSLVD
jgi:hypothetical protein